MPDGRIIAFPASMSDADISGILARDYIKNNPPGVPKPPDAIWQGSNGSNSGLFDQMPRAGSFDFGPSKVGAEVSKRTVGDVTGGAADIAEGNIARGAHRVISGAGTIAAPIALPAAVAAAPVTTALGVVGAGLGSKLGKASAEAFGANEDQAALAGDVGGFAGGIAGGPLSRGAVKGSGHLADFLSDTVDPELTGVISPRLAHIQKLLGRYADVINKRFPASASAEATAATPAAAEPLEGEYVDTPAPAATPSKPAAPFTLADLNPRQLPASASPASSLPYRRVPGDITPEIVGTPNPNVLAGNKGVIVRPRLQLSDLSEPTLKGDVIKPPPSAPSGYKDYLDDQAVIEGMRNDLYNQAKSGGRQQSAEFEAGHSMDKPKWQRQAEAKAQMIIDQAVAKRNAPVKLTETPAAKSPDWLQQRQKQNMVSPEQMGSSLDDLSSLLEASIRMVEQGHLPAKTAVEPIRVDFDESGSVIDADGRHRVIAALQRGDPTIPVQTKLADGSIQTLNLSPAKVARKIGVTPESLKTTDAQQAEFRPK